MSGRAFAASYCRVMTQFYPPGLLHFLTHISQSVQRLVTGWTVRGTNPGGEEIFCTHPEYPWGPTRLLYNGYRVFPRGKAAGASR